jgi:hypothetical protein
MGCILLLGSFFHDPGSVLAGIGSLTLMCLEGFFYSSAFWCVLELKNPATGRAVSGNRIATRVPFDNVHLGFVCHVHSFPQAGADCQPCGLQTAPLPKIPLTSAAP